MTMRMSVPIEDRPSTRRGSVGQAMRGWLRLFLIEMRRSPARVGAIAMAIMTAWLMWQALPVGVVRWLEVSRSGADPVMIPASAIAAGTAAFVAGRDSRLRLDEQITQTAVGSFRCDILAFLVTLIWSLAGYLVVVAGFFGYAVFKATWAGPGWSFVTLTLAMIAFGTAVGWLVGTVFRHRLSPLVAIAVTLGVLTFDGLTTQFRMTEQVMPNGDTVYSYPDSWYKNLLPLDMVDYYARADVSTLMPLGIVWLLALAVVLMSAAWWWRHRSVVAVASLAVALVVSAVAAKGLMNWEPVPRSIRSVYVQPVCEKRLNDQIYVCMHPADTALLADAADAIADLVAPVAGIPGVPTRFEGQQSERLDDSPVVLFYVHDAESIPWQLQNSVLRELLHNPAGPYGTGSAQYVVAAWLLDEAGISRQEARETHLLMPLPFIYSTDADRALGITDPMMQGRNGPDAAELDAFEVEIDAAIDRLSALSPAQQRSWLEVNWDALRAGELTLEDLP